MAVLAAVVVVAALGTWGLYAYLVQRVGAGTDHALRLAAVLVYVGVTDAYTLARALGIVALVLAYASVVVGLDLGRRRARSRPVPALVAVAHRQTGLVTLALAVAHATVPFTALDPPYGGWRTVTVPFGQPVSWGRHAAAYESLGILALYLGLLTGPTFYLLRRRPRAWAVVHRAAVAFYALAVAHTFLVGTDFMVQDPARVALLAAQVPVAALLAARIRPAPAVDPAPGRRPWRWAAFGLGVAVTAGLTVLTVLVATGAAGRGLTA